MAGEVKEKVVIQKLEDDFYKWLRETGLIDDNGMVDEEVVDEFVGGLITVAEEVCEARSKNEANIDQDECVVEFLQDVNPARAVAVEYALRRHNNPELADRLVNLVPKKLIEKIRIRIEEVIREMRREKLGGSDW